MKKITQGFLIISICILSSQAYSQVVALRGGLNLSNFSFAEEANSDVYQSTPGFHIGATFDIALGEMFAVETGILATTKGSQNKYNFGGLTAKSTINILNAEVPLSFKTIFAVGDNLDIYASAGGYFGFALMGINHSKTEFNGEVEKDGDFIDFEDDGFRRLDYGLTFGAGVELKGFIVGAAYDFGLANLDDSGYATVRNRVLRIGIGYRFGWDN